MAQPQSKAEYDGLFDVIQAHKTWGKDLLNLGVIEAKIWAMSGAHLIALICGIVFLLVTTWLLIIASAAALAWSYGLSLPSILLIATSVTLLSAVVLIFAVQKTLRNMNFSRTINALTEEDDA